MWLAKGKQSQLLSCSQLLLVLLYLWLSPPPRCCLLCPGTGRWAGSLLLLRDITFPNIHPWKFVLIWKSAPLSPDCPGYPVSASSLLSEYVCDRERERKGREAVYLTRQTWAALHVFTRDALWLAFFSEWLQVCCACTLYRVQYVSMVGLQILYLMKGLIPHCENTVM